MTDLNKPKIYVDRDRSIDYEVRSFLSKLFHSYFFVPFLNRLPESFSKIIKKSDRAAEHVIENKATHYALETLYSRGKMHGKKSLVSKFFRYVWFNLDNAKAVRNRLRLTKREITKAVMAVSQSKNELEFLSIASGSARSVIEALSEIKKDNFVKINVSFLDKNPDALEYSKKLVEDTIKDGKFSFRWLNDTASRFVNHFENKKVDIVEMLGLLDYFNDEKVLNLLRLIYEKLSGGGFLVTANSDNNHERRCLTNVVGWKMIYRSASELASLAVKAGFKPENIRAVYEPLKIHSILIARK